MLIPCNTSCSDGWLLASAIARETRSIKFCVAIRPGLTTPTFAVQQANTLDLISGGRLTVNVVPGGSSVDARRYGDWAGHDGRYERADEFLDIVRAFWADEDARVNYKGAHYQVEDGFVFPGPARRGGPPLYFGGSSPAAKKVIAKHADVFLKWGEPPWQIAEEFEEVKKMAREEHGRDLKLGVRFHILVREDDAQAREEAEAIIAGTASYGESSSVTGEIAGTGGIRLPAAHERHDGGGKTLARPCAFLRHQPRAPGSGHHARGKPRGGRRRHARIHRPGRDHVHPFRLAA